MSNINPMELRLVNNYLRTGKQKQSAIDAGYSERIASSTATRVLNRPEVLKLMQQRMDAQAARADITANDVLDGIRALIARCELGEPIRRKDGSIVKAECPVTGEMVIQRKPDIANALKGYEMLGKHLRLFTDQVEVLHSGNVTVDHTIQAIGFDEIKAIAESKRATIEGRVINDHDIGDE